MNKSMVDYIVAEGTEIVSWTFSEKQLLLELIKVPGKHP